MNSLNTPSYPAQHTGQLNLQAQRGTRGFQTVGLFDSIDHRLNLSQCAGQSCCQAIRQQTERAMPLRAVPAGDVGAGRGKTLIGPVSGKPAATSRVQRAACQACIAPRLLVNVFLAGEFTLVTELHRPPARTVAPVAGLSIIMGVS